MWFPHRGGKALSGRFPRMNYVVICMMRWLHTLQGGRYLFGIHELRASQLIKMSSSEHTRPVSGIRTGFTVGTDANTDQLPSNLYSKGSHLTFHSPRKPSGLGRPPRVGFFPTPLPTSSFCTSDSSFLLFESTICILITEFLPSLWNAH